jgi:hypothetical protein
VRSIGKGICVTASRPAVCRALYVGDAGDGMFDAVDEAFVPRPCEFCGYGTRRVEENPDAYLLESKVWQPLYREDILDWFTVVYVLR